VGRIRYPITRVGPDLARGPSHRTRSLARGHDRHTRISEPPMNRRFCRTWSRRFDRLCYQLHEAWYRLQCRLWYRYNVVVCRALPPTWCDRDYLLLYAAFQILEDFVQQEEGHFHEDVYPLYADFGDDHAHKRAADWETIRELYAWWQSRKNDARHDDYEQDGVMLHKLIDIRANLWT